MSYRFTDSPFGSTGKRKRDYDYISNSRPKRRKLIDDDEMIDELLSELMDETPTCSNYASSCGNCNHKQYACNIPANDSCNSGDKSSDCNIDEAIVYDFAGVVAGDNGSSYDHYKKRDNPSNQEKKDDSTKTAGNDINKNAAYVHIGTYTTVCGEVYDCFKENASDKDGSSSKKAENNEDKSDKPKDPKTTKSKSKIDPK